MMNEPEQLPPHDADAEAGALACVLTAADEAGKLRGKLTLDDFYDERHRTIFRAIGLVRPVDSVTVTQKLRDLHQEQEAGGLEYLGRLPDASPSPANFPTYLETLHDRRNRRAALRDGTELCRLARDTAIPGAVLADAARKMGEGYSRNGAASGLTVRSPDELLAMRFDDSDCILGDRLLAKGQSLVIAGAGGIGKSRLLPQLAVATIASRGFVGLETHAPELRWLILQAENSNRRLQSDLASLRRWAGDQWPRVNAQLRLHTLESDADGFLSLGDPRTAQRIADTIGETKPDVVAWDSLYNFGAGDLNRDEDMAATLLSISRLTRAGNPNRSPVVLHHALTGKAGAARASGYDRASFGRNSKVLHSWTRGQINVAPGCADSNDMLVLTCGKCSNGKEFAPFAVRLDSRTMIYEPAPDFDMAAWQSEVSGKGSAEPLMTPSRVQELCRLPQSRAELSHAIREDCGCARQVSYRYIKRAEQSRKIRFNERNQTYAAK